MTSAHPPFDVRIFHKECKTLAGAGYDVSLIAPGESDDERDGIRVYAVRKQGKRLRRMTSTTLGVYKIARELNADIYHFHDPELMPVGLMLRLRGKKVVYDVHEEYEQDILHKEYIPPSLRRLVSLAFGGFQKIACPFYSGIVASRPALMTQFKRSKTTLVNNFPILGELQQLDPEPFACRPPLGAYVGGLWESRGAVEMIDALACIPPEVPLSLGIAGEITPPELAERLARTPGSGRAKFLGWQSRAQVADLLGKSLFGLVLFHPIGNHLNSYPTKVFEYMSAGLPVIASDIPLWQEIIAKPKCGILVDPREPKRIAEAIMYMAENRDEAEAMGRRGLEAVITEFNWSVEATRLLDLYAGLAGSS